MRSIRLGNGGTIMTGSRADICATRRVETKEKKGRKWNEHRRKMQRIEGQRNLLESEPKAVLYRCRPRVKRRGREKEAAGPVMLNFKSSAPAGASVSTSESPWSSFHWERNLTKKERGEGEGKKKGERTKWIKGRKQSNG